MTAGRGSIIAYEGARGTTWRIKYRDGAGRQRMETIGQDRQQAEKTLRARLVAIDEGRYAAPSKVTFSVFADRFMAEYATPRVRRKTRIDYQATLRNHLKPAFGQVRLDKVTPEMIDGYVAATVRSGKLSAKTVNNHLRLLHAIFERAVRWRVLKLNPAAAVDKLKVDQADTETLQPDEVRKILDLATPTVRLFVLLAVLTGARKNEVLSLTWDRIDFAAAQLRIDRQHGPDGWAPLKSRKRVHALPAELWQALLDHQAASPYGAPSDFVFATNSGSAIDGRNMLRWFKDTATKAGVTRNVWIHQLRHTAGTRAAEVGLTALEVAALLGHAQASTSERYIHLAAGAGLERAERIAAQAIGSRSGSDGILTSPVRPG
jgi:integrase